MSFFLYKENKLINVIIPTYRPDERFIKLIDKLNEQTIQPDRIIVINTEKKWWDEISVPEKWHNVEVCHIEKSEFDHGNTRNKGMAMADADICICMTMDAVPADERLIEELISPLADERVAVSYARQLAFENSSYTEKLTREFNYPGESQLKSTSDIERLQIKAYFCSNVCCAYNKKVFDELGGFVKQTIFNEDMLYAAKAINAGYCVAYQAEAKVYHSHEYSGVTQFHRNFDNGVSHAQYPEVFNTVTQEGEGFRMVKTVIAKLLKTGHLFEAVRYIWCTACKFIGFKLGCKYESLPRWLVLKCTSDKSYFA